jgi:hypothetical protein
VAIEGFEYESIKNFNSTYIKISKRRAKTASNVLAHKQYFRNQGGQAIAKL